MIDSLRAQKKRKKGMDIFTQNNCIQLAFLSEPHEPRGRQIQETNTNIKLYSYFFGQICSLATKVLSVVSFLFQIKLSVPSFY